MGILPYNTPDSYRDDSRLEQFYWSITDILSVLVKIKLAFRAILQQVLIYQSEEG